MIISTFDELKLSKVERDIVAPDGYHPAPPSFSFTRGDGVAIPSSPDDVNKFNQLLIKGYDLVYDSPTSAHDAFDASIPHLSKLDSATRDPGINMGEEDIVSKFSIQRRLPPRYFISSDRLPEGTISSDFDMCLKAYVAKVAATTPILGANPLAIMLSDSDPFDTNQGFPTYSTSPELRFSTASALSIPEYKTTSILERIADLSLSLGFERWMLWPAAIAKRTGPTHKPVRVYQDHSDGYSCTSVTEATGYYTRARKVYMMPFYFNMLISPVAMALKHGRIRIRGFGHDLSGEASYLPFFTEDPKFETAESDLSGFDTSITPALRKRLWYWCRQFGFNTTALDLLEEFENTTVVFSAPYNTRQKGQLAYCHGRFGLLSGLKVTTEVGSAISAAATLKALYRCGVITRKQIESGDWPLFLMLGDDILLRTRTGSINPDVFEASYAEEGLKVKYLAPGKRFLMNHIKGGTKYGVAARTIQQTLFNEDSYAHIGQIRLGLASRLTKTFLPEHWSILKGWADDMAQVTRVPEVFKCIINSASSLDAMSKLLADSSIQEFLLSAAGESWIQNLSAKNDMSGKFAPLLAQLGSVTKNALASAQVQRKALVSALFNRDVHIHNQSLRNLNNHLTGV